MRCIRLAIPAVLVLAGCSSVPTAPDVAVMPAPNKPLQVFEDDDIRCRDYAQRALGVDPRQHEQDRIATSALTGAAIGAVAGVAIGHGHGEAAAVGAGAGLLAGTAAGTERAAYDSYRLQERYDIAYMQCMYTKGNQVPGYPMASAPPPPPPPPRR
jgi:uncharacterized protein YcfJ